MRSDYASQQERELLDGVENVSVSSRRFVFPPLFSLLIGSFTPATNYTDGLVCFTFARISNLCSEMLTRRLSTCTGFCCAAFRERWDINHGQHSAEFVLNGFSWRVRWVKGAAAVWLKQQKTKCWTVVAFKRRVCYLTHITLTFSDIRERSNWREHSKG